MRSSPGRPRKRAPKKPSQQPTNADVRRFVKEGEGPNNTNIFGYHCQDCDKYETMIGGAQQKRAIDKMALTHNCDKPGLHEVPKRKDIDG